MKEILLNNWIEVSQPALIANYRTLQAAAGSQTTLLAVIKANAYGHGAERCAQILAGIHAPWLGVTCASEGVRVRQSLGSGFQPDILVMSGSLPSDTAALVPHNLIPVVWTLEHLATLPPGQRIHVEVDTGMARQGVLPGPPLAELLEQITARNLVLDGIFTHFASAEVAASPFTQRQQQRFQQVVAQLALTGQRPAWLHAGNSSLLDNPLDPDWLPKLAATLGARAMVRPGLALYGYTLPIEGEANAHVAAQLQPVLIWQARVLAVRTLAPGESIGYNATFTATQPMRIALLPVGYADGLRRELSSTGWVILRGLRANILGRISMNLTVVDITAIPDVHAGDPATLLGPGITAHDHAALAQTIPYEILCGIHPCG